jgi:hypothetical protein
MSKHFGLLAEEFRQIYNKLDEYAWINASIMGKSFIHMNKDYGPINIKGFKRPKVKKLFSVNKLHIEEF